MGRTWMELQTGPRRIWKKLDGMNCTRFILVQNRYPRVPRRTHDRQTGKDALHRSVKTCFATHGLVPCCGCRHLNLSEMFLVVFPRGAAVHPLAQARGALSGTSKQQRWTTLHLGMHLCIRVHDAEAEHTCCLAAGGVYRSTRVCSCRMRRRA